MIMDDVDAKAWIDELRPRRPVNKPEPEGRSLISPDGELLDDQHRRDLGHLGLMRRRELGLGAPNRRTLEQREQYLELGMNETVYDVPCEFSFAKRFSPCGKYLICFGKEPRSIQVYAVDYCSRPGEDISVRDLFSLAHDISLPCPRNERVAREFCLFVPGGQEHLMIIASSVSHGPLTEPSDNDDFARVQTHHSLPLHSSLDEYSFWLIDYRSGKVHDQLLFKSDNMVISYHAGVSICGPFFSVTSLQHQVIRIYEIVQKKFVPLRSIGPRFDEDDPVWAEGQLIGIRQRLVAYLYCEALTMGHQQHFHRQLGKYLALAIWKASFFDREHMLIKLGPKVQLMTKYPDAPSEHFIAMWSIPEGRIVKLYADHNLTELADLARSHNSMLRFGGLYADDQSEFLATCGLSFTSTSSNSLYEQLYWDRIVGVVGADSKRKMATSIPQSSQVMSCTVSPFFDSELFRYDDKVISPIERLRQDTEATTKIFSRRTGELLMKLSAGADPGHVGLDGRRKRYNNWIVHPFLPLAVSMQVSSGQATCNIHYRSCK